MTDFHNDIPLSDYYRRDEVRAAHQCPQQPPADGDGPPSNVLTNYGTAIGAIVQAKADARWYATNGEYATQIWFCPWCGVELVEAREGGA